MASVRRRNSQPFVGRLDPQLPTEDLDRMKHELQSLTKEKSMLKAKIVRLQELAKHPNPTEQGPSYLVEELKKTLSYNDERKSEITALLNSDLAALIKEQREECVILHEELVRQRRVRTEREADLRELTSKIENAQRRISSDVVARNQKLIATLERQLEQQTERVETAKRNMHKQMDDTGISTRAREVLEASVHALEERIKAEEAEIAALDNEIERQRESYEMEFSGQ